MLLQNISGRFKVKTERADTFFRRLKGLMFRKNLPDGQAILLSPCTGIHTCFMRFPIDVVYLDDDYIVIGKEQVAPWKIGKRIKGTQAVLETAAGAAANVKLGDPLIFDSE